MEHKTCCFSGHRKLPIDQALHINNLLVNQIFRLIDKGVNNFICGGALGFDTIAAQTVIKARAIYPNIQLIMALPSPEQTKGWRINDIDNYHHILKQANHIVYTSTEHHAGCMHIRNHYMVNHSQYCICYMMQATGGTVHTVNYARKKGLSIINIADESFEEQISFFS